MNAAVLFVRCLEAEGVEYIFGVPGEENADFKMALETSDSIRFVLTRHEQGLEIQLLECRRIARGALQNA